MEAEAERAALAQRKAEEAAEKAMKAVQSRTDSGNKAESPVANRDKNNRGAGSASKISKNNDKASSSSKERGSVSVNNKDGGRSSNKGKKLLAIPADKFASAIDMSKLDKRLDQLLGSMEKLSELVPVVNKLQQAYVASCEAEDEEAELGFGLGAESQDMHDLIDPVQGDSRNDVIDDVSESESEAEAGEPPHKKAKQGITSQLAKYMLFNGKFMFFKPPYNIK